MLMMSLIELLVPIPYAFLAVDFLRLFWIWVVFPYRLMDTQRAEVAKFDNGPCSICLSKRKKFKIAANCKHTFCGYCLV